MSCYVVEYNLIAYQNGNKEFRKSKRPGVLTVVTNHPSLPKLELLTSPDWQDYALLDSGNGLKLERYGAYTFVRPEAQAVWKPALTEKHWLAAEATFITSREENGGHWQFRVPIQPAGKWVIKD